MHLIAHQLVLSRFQKSFLYTLSVGAVLIAPIVLGLIQPQYYTGGIWYANHTTLNGIDTSANTVVTSIAHSQEVSDIAVDPNNHSLYVLTAQYLRKFTPDGMLEFELVLSDLENQLSLPTSIKINSFDGSIWIAGNKTILHLSSSGQLLLNFRHLENIDSISLGMDGNLWVLAKDRLFRLTEAGLKFNNQDLSTIFPNARHLITDPLGDVIWLANQKQLIQIKLTGANPPNPPFYINDPAGIRQLALDTMNGTLWVATNDTLMGYDRIGRLVTTIPIPARLKPVEALEVDSILHDIWVGTKKVVARFSEYGVLIAELPVANELEALAVATAFPRPVVTIINPEDNSVSNDSKPSIQFGLSGLCGVRVCDPGDEYYKSMVFDVVLNGSTMGNVFSVDGNHAIYNMPIALPDGNNSLSVVGIDFYNSRSEPATSNFVIDTLPPKFIEIIPADQSVLMNPEIFITGSVDDLSAVVSLENIDEVGGQIISTDPQNFEFKVPLFPGMNTFNFKATDAAGNTGYKSLVLYLYAPISLVITNLEDGMEVNGDTLTVTGTVQGPPGTIVLVNGIQATVDANGNFTVDIPIVPGSNTITIVAITPDGKKIVKTYTVNAPSSGGQWELPTNIESHGHKVIYPIVKTDGQGNAIAAWLQKTSSDPSPVYANLWVNHYKPGIGWGQAIFVTRGLGRYKPFNLNVTDTGYAALSWSKPYLGQGNNLQVRFYHPDTGWSQTHRANESWDDAGPFNNNVIVNKDGTAVAVWSRKDQIDPTRPWEIVFELWSRDYSPASGWGVPRRVEGNLQSEYIDSSRIHRKIKNGTLIWHQIEIVNGISVRRMYASRKLQSGGWSKGELFPEVTTRGGDHSADMAIDEMGNALVVWQKLLELSSGPDQHALYAARYVVGQGWQPAKALTGVLHASPNGYSESVSVDGRGNGVVVWQDHGRGSPSWARIFSKAYSVDQDSWGETTEIGNILSETLRQANLFAAPQPHIEMNINGLAMITWQDRELDLDEFKYVLKPYQVGSGWKSNIRIDGGWLLARGGLNVTSGLDRSGNAMVLWNRYDSYPYYSPLSLWGKRYVMAAGGVYPTVVAPPDITVEATASLTFVDLGTATANDPKDGPLTATPNQTGPFGVGVHPVIWSATNSTGLTGTAFQTVIVKDTTPPVLTVPDDITVTITDPGELPTQLDIGIATATDFFQPVTISNNAPNGFDAGSTKVIWYAEDVNGNISTGTQKVTVNYTGGLYLRITDPLSGSTADREQVMVTGVVVGPSNTGVVVNGVLASIYNGRFYANNVPLTTGDNTLKAVATIPNGATQEDSVIISRTGQLTFRVSATPTEGTSPLEVIFSIEVDSDSSIVNIELDVESDGTTDFSLKGTSIEHTQTYADLGYYLATITATGVDGSKTSQSISIVVEDAATMDSLFNSLWDGMNTALKTGNKDQAMSYLNGKAKLKYGPVFDALLPHMTEIVDSYSPISRVSISQNIGEYAVTTNYEGKNHMYLIYFLRGADGVWRMDAM